MFQACSFHRTRREVVPWPQIHHPFLFVPCFIAWQFLRWAFPKCQLAVNGIDYLLLNQEGLASQKRRPGSLPTPAWTEEKSTCPSSGSQLPPSEGSECVQWVLPWLGACSNRLIRISQTENLCWVGNPKSQINCVTLDKLFQLSSLGIHIYLWK